MLHKIMSGGQTGADQAAWRTARTYGVTTGGWMPQGFLTAEGLRPDFAALYDAEELPTDSESDRTERNVADSDATLWFGITITSGAQATIGACQRLGKPCMIISPEATFEPEHVTRWIAEQAVDVLNVAGNREEEEPGIGKRVERFLGEVLQRLGHDRS